MATARLPALPRRVGRRLWRREPPLHSTRDQHVVDIGSFGRKSAGVPMRVALHLPPGYEEGDARYPLLYMLDGQNAFDAATAFLGQAWDADKIHDELIERGSIEPFVIAAIDSQRSREELYTPVPDDNVGGGRLHLLERCILVDLDRYLRRYLRLRPGRESTGILGSSLGGLAAFHLAWRHPDVFGLVGMMSPALWWADGYTLEMVRCGDGIEQELRIWIDTGTEEEEDGCTEDDDDESALVFDNKATVEELHDLLQAVGHETRLFIDEGAPHSEAAWRNRLPIVFEWLFGAAATDETVAPTVETAGR